MLTKGDEYPIHQTPEPIAYAGSDPNFYDRYFFNGYSRDGETFFAVAMGIYPGRDVIDAAVSVVHGGRQRSVFASRVLGMERMDTQVGPISVEVVEPLRKLRVRVDPNEHGIAADLLFECRARALEEPRFRRRNGPRVFMDLTRLTQHGTFAGWIETDGARIDVRPDRFWGGRDRSWGIRPVGEQAPAGAVAQAPQFYWLWAPVNFDDRVVLFDVNEDAEGIAWHRNAMVAAVGDEEPLVMADAQQTLDFKSGTRHARSARIALHPHSGPEQLVELEPLYNFYMLGIGYGHPERGHGRYQGALSVAGEELETEKVDEMLPQHQHIQAFCRARLDDGSGKAREGVGVLEQIVIGPHAPSGFKDIFDPAP